MLGQPSSLRPQWQSLKPAQIGQQHCRLYCYRGVAVLLPGWVIWKYWNCPCKFFSLGNWLVSALSTPNEGEEYNHSTDLSPYTITSIQFQRIQAARSHLADKAVSSRMYKSSPCQPIYCAYIWKKYPKRVALATKYLTLVCGRAKKVYLEGLGVLPRSPSSTILILYSRVL
jgi:hypothetical protein